MQDRYRQLAEIFLQRTAGPYIGVIRRFQHLRVMSALPRIATMNSETTRGADSRRLPLLAVPPQTASVQLSENANADVEKGRPSRSRGQDCPLASMPLRTRRVPSAGINTVHTP